MTPYITRKSTW